MLERRYLVNLLNVVARTRPDGEATPVDSVDGEIVSEGRDAVKFDALWDSNFVVLFD